MAIIAFLFIASPQFNHPIDAQVCFFDSFIIKQNFFSTHYRYGVIYINKRGCFHIRANQVFGQRIKMLFRTLVGKMLSNTDFCTNNEIWFVRCFCVLHNRWSWTDKICKHQYIRCTFRMNQHFGVWMRLSRRLNIFRRNPILTAEDEVTQTSQIVLSSAVVFM